MDRHEFAKQYQAVFARLWLIAVSIVGDRTDAEDIVQEAAVIAFRKLDTFEVGTSFGAWAAQIVRYCAANHNRKAIGRNTQSFDPTALDQHPDPSSSQMPFDSLKDPTDYQLAFDDNIMRGLSQLSAEARACLLLRVVDELPYAEIAELMRIPEGTAMSHVHRSKKQLRLGYRGDFGRKVVPNE